MNDLEKFLSIINGKIEYTLTVIKDSYYKNEFPNSETRVEINPNLGYNGFWSDWIFDKDGNFLGVAHWE